MKNWQGSLFKLIQGLALLLVLGLGALLLASAWMIHRLDFRLYGVQTGSMAPAIVAGDGLIVRPAAFATLQAGDVISFRAKDQTVISHRVVQLDRLRQTALTKGDRNQFPDGAVAANQIVGRATATIPYLGRLQSTVRRPSFLVGLVYVPTISLAVHEVRRLERYFQKPYRVAGFRAR